MGEGVNVSHAGFTVMAGLVPAIPQESAARPLSGSPGIRAFTPVFNGLCPATRCQNFDTSTSFVVMNSSSAGLPSCVASMPRLIAGTMSAGFSTRSP